MKKIKLIIAFLIIFIIITSIILIFILSNKRKMKNYRKEDYLISEKYKKLEDTIYLDKLFINLFYYNMIGNVDAVNQICIERINDLPNYIDSFNISEVYYKEGNQEKYISININNTEYYFILIMDSKNNTYELKEISKELFNKIKNNEYDTTKYDNYTIEKKSFFNSMGIKDSVIAEFCLIDYYKKIKENPQKAYELLDEEYRENRFTDYNDFIQYIKNNQEELEWLYRRNLNKYTKKDETRFYNVIGVNSIFNIEINGNSNIITYTVQDPLYNNYIIKIEYPFKYSIILDTYTLENRYNRKSYELGTQESKGLYNLNIFLEAINIKDYHTAYNKLNDTFRKSSFPTQESFITFIKDKMFENNKIEFYSFSTTESGYLIFDIKLSNSDEGLKPTIFKDISFIIDNRGYNDFTLSIVID